MFHVSNLKKCMTDEPFAIPLDEIQIEEKLYFIEEPVKIMDREVKRLNQSRIPIAKVYWNSRRGPEFTLDQGYKEPVILFDTIPTTIPDTTPSVISPTTHIDTIPITIVSPTIPPSPDYTPVSPDYSPASNTEFDPFEAPSSNHIPPLPAISPFLSSTDDSSDSDISDTPPSPTHGIPFTEMTLSTQSTPIESGALRLRVMVLAPGHPIPHGRSFIIEFIIKDFIRLFCRCFILILHLDISSFDSISLPTPFISHSRKRSRSPTASVPLSLPIPRVLSYARANLLPSPKRIRSYEFATDLEVSLVEDSEPS
ncbi:hypothetical protein Tco_0828510, partial [Tanacetum coccineum]